MKRRRQVNHQDNLMNMITRIMSGVVLLVAINAWNTWNAQALGNREVKTPERMRRFSGEIIAAYERRDTKTLKSFYAQQPGALFFWERKMSYSWQQIDHTYRLISKRGCSVEALHERISLRRFGK